MTQTPAARKQLIWMTGGVLLMFVFAVFAMPPIYRVFCEITGLNGKPSAMAAGESTSVDLDREITVEFITIVDSGLPWQFTSERRVMKVHPGEIHQVNFAVSNQAGVPVTGKAIPSVAPSAGAAHLKKTECFCFIEQTLAAGESMDMPLVFYIDPALPKQIGTVTLAYRFYRQADAG